MKSLPRKNYCFCAKKPVCPKEWGIALSASVEVREGMNIYTVLSVAFPLCQRSKQSASLEPL